MKQCIHSSGVKLNSNCGGLADYGTEQGDQPDTSRDSPPTIWVLARGCMNATLRRALSFPPRKLRVSTQSSFVPSPLLYLESV